MFDKWRNARAERIKAELFKEHTRELIMCIMSDDAPKAESHAEWMVREGLGGAYCFGAAAAIVSSLVEQGMIIPGDTVSLNFYDKVRDQPTSPEQMIEDCGEGARPIVAAAQLVSMVANDDPDMYAAIWEGAPERTKVEIIVALTTMSIPN